MPGDSKGGDDESNLRQLRRTTRASSAQPSSSRGSSTNPRNSTVATKKPASKAVEKNGEPEREVAGRTRRASSAEPTSAAVASPSKDRKPLGPSKNSSAVNTRRQSLLLNKIPEGGDVDRPSTPTKAKQDGVPAVGTPRRRGRTSIAPAVAPSPVRLTRRSAAALAAVESAPVEIESEGEGAKTEDTSPQEKSSSQPYAKADVGADEKPADKSRNITQEGIQSSLSPSSRIPLQTSKLPTPIKPSLSPEPGSLVESDSRESPKSSSESRKVATPRSSISSPSTRTPSQSNSPATPKAQALNATRASTPTRRSPISGVCTPPDRSATPTRKLSARSRSSTPSHSPDTRASVNSHNKCYTPPNQSPHRRLSRSSAKLTGSNHSTPTQSPDPRSSLPNENKPSQVKDVPSTNEKTPIKDIEPVEFSVASVQGTEESGSINSRENGEKGDAEGSAGDEVLSSKITEANIAGALQEQIQVYSKDESTSNETLLDETIQDIDTLKKSNVTPEAAEIVVQAPSPGRVGDSTDDPECNSPNLECSPEVAKQNLSAVLEESGELELDESTVKDEEKELEDKQNTNLHNNEKTIGEGESSSSTVQETVTSEQNEPDKQLPLGNDHKEPSPDRQRLAKPSPENAPKDPLDLKNSPKRKLSYDLSLTVDQSVSSPVKSPKTLRLSIPDTPPSELNRCVSPLKEGRGLPKPRELSSPIVSPIASEINANRDSLKAVEATISVPENSAELDRTRERNSADLDSPADNGEQSLSKCSSGDHTSHETTIEYEPVKDSIVCKEDSIVVCNEPNPGNNSVNSDSSPANPTETLLNIEQSSAATERSPSKTSLSPSQEDTSLDIPASSAQSSEEVDPSLTEPTVPSSLDIPAKHSTAEIDLSPTEQTIESPSLEVPAEQSSAALSPVKSSAPSSTHDNVTTNIAADKSPRLISPLTPPDGTISPSSELAPANSVLENEASEPAQPREPVFICDEESVDSGNASEEEEKRKTNLKQVHSNQEDDVVQETPSLQHAEVYLAEPNDLAESELPSGRESSELDSTRLALSEGDEGDDDSDEDESVDSDEENESEHSDEELLDVSRFSSNSRRRSRVSFLEQSIVTISDEDESTPGDKNKVSVTTDDETEGPPAIAQTPGKSHHLLAADESPNVQVTPSVKVKELVAKINGNQPRPAAPVVASSAATGFVVQDALSTPEVKSMASKNFTSSTAAGFVVEEVSADSLQKVNIERQMKRKSSDPILEPPLPKVSRQNVSEGGSGKQVVVIRNIPKSTQISQLKAGLQQVGLATGLQSVRFASIGEYGMKTALAAYDSEKNAMKAQSFSKKLKINGQPLFILIKENASSGSADIHGSPKRKFTGIIENLPHQTTISDITSAFERFGLKSSSISLVQILRYKSNPNRIFAKIRFFKKTALLKAIVVSEHVTVHNQKIKMSLKEQR